MRLNNEGGINDVSRKFPVICKNFFSYCMKEIFNFCITTGVYPDVFKIAQITPSHKKGSLHIKSNYSPVSVLSNLSKVFENLIYNRLRSFCQRSIFHVKTQSGFLKNLIQSWKLNFNG